MCTSTNSLFQMFKKTSFPAYNDQHWQVSFKLWKKLYHIKYFTNNKLVNRGLQSERYIFKNTKGKIHIWYVQRNTLCRMGSQHINTVDDTTINFNDVNRYQGRADISIFRNEFIRIDTRLSLFPLYLQISHLILPSCPFSDYSFNHLSGHVFRKAIYCDSYPAIEPLLPVMCPSSRKQFIRLFVFRLGVPRGLFRFLLVLVLFLLGCSRSVRARTFKLFSDSDICRTYGCTE